MVKRLSTLVVAGLLALPTAALAQGDLEDRIAALEEKQESWDLGSRIQWNGDFRFRADYLTADAPSHYTALNVASGIKDFYDLNDHFGAAAGNNIVSPATYVATIGDILTSFGSGTPTGTCDANCMAEMGGTIAALSPTEQETMKVVLPLLNSGMTVAKLAGAFGATFADRTNAQPVAEFMKGNFTAAERKDIFAALGYDPNAAATYENDTIYT
ncbi:MAG: hypothetical protein P1P81_09650, partial [Desulfobulbales bacterium]|nr:hypothetical protein [Desulfobulbales bacterium]